MEKTEAKELLLDFLDAWDNAYSQKVHDDFIHSFLLNRNFKVQPKKIVPEDIFDFNISEIKMLIDNLKKVDESLGQIIQTNQYNKKYIVCELKDGAWAPVNDRFFDSFKQAHDWMQATLTKDRITTVTEVVTC